MNKTSTLLATLLFAAVSVAHADTTANTTTPGSTGATSVEKNLTSETGASAKSSGHADKGLTTAQEHITAEHGKPEKVEKADKAAKPERPARPERAGK